LEYQPPKYAKKWLRSSISKQREGFYRACELSEVACNHTTGSLGARCLALSS
jgi:hypothetical protein